MAIELPGGLLRDGRLQRSVTLHELTGVIELRIGELWSAYRSWPELVTGLLEAMVVEVGAARADREALDALSVGDRRYLMLRLLAELQGEQFWITTSCARCGKWFDLGLERSSIPVKPAGEGFPFAVAQIGEHSVQLRVPTGADQAAIADEPREAALRHIAERCVLAIDGAVSSGPLSAEVRDAIEAALDAVSPDVASQLLTHCPECDCEQVVEYDPCVPTQDVVTGLFEEIHVMASHYHWSECEILALPRSRRRMYLGLIERSALTAH